MKHHENTARRSFLVWAFDWWLFPFPFVASFACLLGCLPLTLQAVSTVSRFPTLLLLIGTFLLTVQSIISALSVSSGDQVYRGFASTLFTRSLPSSVSLLQQPFG
jgi:hypothetical protein